MEEPIVSSWNQKVKYGGWTVLEFFSNGLLGPNASLATLGHLGGSVC